MSCRLVQVFQYLDPGIAYGSHTSVEALVGAIVGGLGTLWGPVLGALALHALADLTRNLFGQLPGINLVIYGTVNSVVDQILRLREQTGEFGELVYAGMDWVDPALAKRSMELMANEVMPRVNAAIAAGGAAKKAG